MPDFISNKQFVHYIQLHSFDVAGCRFVYSHNREDIFYFNIFRNERSIFDVQILFRPRKLQIVEFSYSDPQDLMFQPDELRRWSPVLFLNFSNPDYFLKYLDISLKYFLFKNPRLCV